ncbi:MAG: DPP IV N-terminal domain-containing protein [Chloroflexota bacterium]|nr:MAG: DPP IV N-terminal domain-containing protein [Chloroflexota bacterium]
MLHVEALHYASAPDHNASSETLQAVFGRTLIQMNRSLHESTRWAAKIGYIAILLMGLSTAIAISACATPAPEFVDQGPVPVTLQTDGETFSLTSESANVRELLEESGVTLGDADLIDPPLFTPLTEDLLVKITRVTESIEIIEQGIPYQRRSVRSESMQSDDPPIIVQTGRPGLQELTVRIVYHDGLEFGRQESRVTIIEPARDEIVMIGVGSAPRRVEFAGLLAYIAGGNSIVLRGSSAFPEQLDTGSDLDRRVFTLSPNGSHLLYTRAITDTERFNNLWVIETTPDAEPQPLDVDNVLWADWNPEKPENAQIAFTTGTPTELLPGWEANNDLWLADLRSPEEGIIRPELLVEAYPATYGWWGGNYAWSPQGRYIAYSYADEVGLIDTEADEDEEQRLQLRAFTEYNTQADWVWVPSLSWSPDGAFLAFTRHAGDDPDALLFDTWVINVEDGTDARFVQQSGIWGHPSWSPFQADLLDDNSLNSQIAFLRATNPVESVRSSYTLWLMDRDGSNARQIYPAAGENSRFPREQNAMAWGPAGRTIAFVYDGDLFMYDLENGEVKRITQDDSIASNPSRAPYGLAPSEAQPQSELPVDITPIPVRPGIGISE